jgi:hypothetical protein
MVAIPSAINIPLLFSDASDILLGALLQPTWGVYLNGMPVLSPAPYNNTGGLAGTLASVVQIAGTIGNVLGSVNSLLGGGTGGVFQAPVVPAIASTVEFEYLQDLPIANYPQENGAFQAYNKATMPFSIRLRVCSGGSVSARQAFLYTCQAIKDSFQLFTVITPEMVFSSANCSHIDWRRTADRGNTLIQVDLTFEQVPIVAATSLTNTIAPGDAGQQSIGSVIPQQNSSAGFTAPLFQGQGVPGTGRLYVSPGPPT